MSVRSERCERVTERDEFVGRFSVASRFPQYLGYGQYASFVAVMEGGVECNTHLMTAMLTGAVVVARKTVLSAMAANVKRNKKN